MVKPDNWTHEDWNMFCEQAEKFSLTFPKLKTYPFRFSPGDLITVNNNAETLRGRCGVIIEFSTVPFMPYVVRILGTTLHQMYGGFELEPTQFGTRSYHDVLWCDHCTARGQCSGQDGEYDNVEWTQPEDVDRSLRFNEYWSVATEYYTILQEGKHTDKKEELKERLDMLAAPFSDDIAFNAFLAMERYVALGE